MIKKIGLYITEMLYYHGGTESYTVKLAQALQRIYSEAEIYIITEVFAKKDNVSQTEFANSLNKIYGSTLDINKIHLVPVALYKKNFVTIRLCRAKIQNCSKKFDLFFYCSVGNYVFKAKKNIAIIHFPAKKIVEQKKEANKFDIPFFTKLKDKKYSKSYDLYLPNSSFTQKWLQTFWNEIDTKKIKLVYPPITPIVPNGEKKEKRILACSRFEPSKKIEVLIQAYKTSSYLCANYKLDLVGSFNIEDKNYLEELKKSAAGFNIVFHVDVPHKELVSLYNKAEFFWHSKGFGIEENIVPYAMEHFGMTTVEAMSASCIPIVINKGGQPEIVTENVGFTWNTTEELISYTELLAKDDNKKALFAKNALERSKYFCEEIFYKQIKDVLQSIEAE